MQATVHVDVEDNRTPALNNANDYHILCKATLFSLCTLADKLLYFTSPMLAAAVAELLFH
jgi:hypothetical protein